MFIFPGPIASVFVNKYGCRAVTIAGSILASICMLVSVYAESLLTLYLTIGFGTGIYELIIIVFKTNKTSYYLLIIMVCTGFVILRMINKKTPLVGNLSFIIICIKP